ncbi:SPASM domain-containing protein [Limnospira platensis CENA597]|uniref:SPASM domain-containing protein n=1 Tax=Oscillatoriales TaxID=1150 RepID=UPI00396F3ECE
MLAKIQRHLAAPSAKEFLDQLRCDNPFCHAGINMIVVKETGEVYPCGCAGSSGNVQSYLLGNILDPDGFDPDEWKQKLHGFHGKTDKYEKDCRTCPAKFVCEHGCPAFDLNDSETPENHCGATKRFERYLRTLPLEAIEQVAQMSPQMAKSKKAADIMTNWQ